MFIFLSLTGVLSSNNKTSPSPVKSDHKLSFAWSIHPILGLLGTVLNSLVLFMFVKERQNMVTLINIMILLDTLYRLMISLVAVPWKCYLMATDSYIFSSLITSDMVKS